ncbi:MAG: DUF456 domain-containing protein [Planctomycetota bacterium]
MIESWSETATSWTIWLQDVATIGGSIVLALMLVLLCAMAWLLNLLTLPGNWIAVAFIGIYVWLGPQDGAISISTATVGWAFAVALLGELLEFAAGAVGTKRAGASRRATLMAIVGSMVGAIAGGIVGIPIPVVGPMLAALLFGGFGATLGAIFAEWQDGRPWRENWRIGRAAFWGRTAGTVGKMIAGLTIVLMSIFGVLLP